MKKRSLFVATAMLLVAVLVATGATYAWFTSVSNANAQIVMDVAGGESLQIQANSSDWLTKLTTNELGLDQKNWIDLSTNDTDVKTGVFYDEEYNNPDDETQVTGFNVYDDTGLASVTINFRASRTGNITISAGDIANGANITETLKKALRVGVVNGDLTQIFSVDGTDINDAIGEKEDVIGENSAQTTRTFAEGTKIVDLATEVSGDGYYHGSATFYFWVEGTECDNTHLAGTLTDIAANLTFKLN